MINNPRIYHDVRKPHGPVVNAGGGGDRDKSIPLEYKSKEFCELLCTHLTSVFSLRMRPSNWAGKVNSLEGARTTFDFANLNNSPVAFANIVFGSDQEKGTVSRQEFNGLVGVAPSTAAGNCTGT